MTIPAERRKAPRRDEDVSRDDASEIKDMLGALIGTLTVHMTQEEIEIANIKHKLEEFFHDLDAHTHIYHHNKVAEDIKEEDETHQFWSKIKSSATEKAIMFGLGVIAMYLASLVWLDFGNRINSMPNPPQVTPSYFQPQPQPSQNVTIQLPKQNPPATPNAQIP